MSKQTSPHTFHIPVMGIGFTLDSPLKVAPYGISSVISLVDDSLMERVREFYSSKFGIPFKPISNRIEDFRAKRITSYLDLLDHLVKRKFEELKNTFQEKSGELAKYIDMLPDFSHLKREFKEMVQGNSRIQAIREWIHKNLSMGDIDANIMTKLDKENYRTGEKLPIEFNDAHAALRGFARSRLNSAIVLSAGINPKLYSYLENFDDFYPDGDLQLKKRIILKVSDFRSALVQGKFLAKKGLWVSEYRVESGLNCGGHAFANEGYLMGPILAEFLTSRENLIATTHELYARALKTRNRPVPDKPFPIRITAQGGVGTADEHRFLLQYYKLDSVGWGSPFLLVKEATSMDDQTRLRLSVAEEKDLYLSDISPLGIPFNNLKNNTKDLEKLERIKNGKPGSHCPKKLSALNYEFDSKGLCVASRKYQRAKIAELESKKLSAAEFQREYEKIVSKSCICVGLGTGILLQNGLDTAVEGPGVSVCPGPNIAYFSKMVSLKEMVGHIYGRNSLIERNDRPNMFIKEISVFIDYLRNKVSELLDDPARNGLSTLIIFKENVRNGIEYYKKLFNEQFIREHRIDAGIQDDLEDLGYRLDEIVIPA